jgi:hypothetical protein
VQGVAAAASGDGMRSRVEARDRDHRVAIAVAVYDAAASGVVRQVRRVLSSGRLAAVILMSCDRHVRGDARWIHGDRSHTWCVEAQASSGRVDDA